MRKPLKMLKKAYFYKKMEFRFSYEFAKLRKFSQFLAKKCEFVCEILRILQTIYIEPVRIRTNLQFFAEISIQIQIFSQ
jgi:uncharacterized protein YwgA